MTNYIEDLYKKAEREMRAALDEFCPMDEEEFKEKDLADTVVDILTSEPIETIITLPSIPTPSGGIMEIEPQTIVIIPEPEIPKITDLDCPHFFYKEHVIDEDSGYCIHCEYRDYTILSDYSHELMQVFIEFKLRKQWFVTIVDKSKTKRYITFIVPSDNIKEPSIVIDIPVKKYTYNEIAMTLDALPDWEALK